MARPTPTALRKHEDVEITIGRKTGTTRPAGETDLRPTYSKTTGVTTHPVPRRNDWVQENYGSRDVRMYTVGLDPSVDIEKEDVVKITSSSDRTDLVAGDHLVVRRLFNRKGKAIFVDLEYHPEFTDNNELS